MTPKSRLRERLALNEYRAEVLEGVASYIEQLPIDWTSSTLAVRDKIVRDIREAK